MAKQNIITLLTDFGNQDFFVGAMKGVILSIADQAPIVDLSHQVPPQDIHSASYLLLNAYSFFPPGTIHVSVVDPGVGSSRKILLAETAKYRFLAPDNGLLHPILEKEKQYTLYEVGLKYALPRVSSTFHGRDILAPTAAWLSMGLHPSLVGTPIQEHISLSSWKLEEKQDRIIGRVVYIDHFGNLMTNIPVEKLARPFSLQIQNIPFLNKISNSYRDDPNHPVALESSNGCLEIGLFQRNAAKTFQIQRGEIVTLLFQE